MKIKATSPASPFAMPQTSAWQVALPLVVTFFAALIIGSSQPASAADASDAGKVTVPVLEKLEDSAEVVKPPIPPSKSELADSAFKKLDVGAKGYVTRDEIREVDGFDKVFDTVDVDRTGRLNEAEFRQAWETYSGNKP